MCKISSSAASPSLKNPQFFPAAAFSNRPPFGGSFVRGRTAGPAGFFPRPRFRWRRGRSSEHRPGCLSDCRQQRALLLSRPSSQQYSFSFRSPFPPAPPPTFSSFGAIDLLLYLFPIFFPVGSRSRDLTTIPANSYFASADGRPLDDRGALRFSAIRAP